MRSFFLKHKINSITRLTYPAGSGTNGTYQEIYSDGYCHIKPMGEEQAATNNFSWGRAFIAQLDDAIDLQQGDKMTVDGVQYNVRGVASYGGSTPYKRAQLTLPEGA